LKKHLLTYVLLAGFAASLVTVLVRLRGYPLPGNQEGYSPAQPIVFSHKLHAGDLDMNCLYCHYSASRSPHAGIPPSSLCMNCHRLVTASSAVMRAEQDKARQEGRPPRRIVSKDLKELYDAMRLDDELLPQKGQEPVPIRWVKVHNLPDYTRFDHRAHVNAKVKCQECHGPVETMEVIRQSADLSMGWCVKCHKDYKENDGRKLSPSTDCATCHY
jgi:hypothetical protein